jgi:rRNA maturation RNase YbeY
MIKVYVKKQSNYPVDTKKIKSELKELLKSKGIVSNSVVNVSLVGQKKGLQLARKYLSDKYAHNVLSFPASEAKAEFVYPPDSLLHLGDIVVCYPNAVAEAKKENKLIDEKVLELVKHGALHLLGEHHN